MTADPPTAPPPDRAAAPIEERLAAAGLPALPRLAWLEVDLDRLAANARALREALPATARLGVVVKADGYGHGLAAAAMAAARGGADVLAVATLDEALVLREAGRGEPILVLYPVPPASLEAAAAASLDVVAADESSLAAVAALAGATGRVPRVHLAVDTGMGRGGFLPPDVVPAALRLLGAGLPGLAGTWSHLAAPEDPAASAAQVARFEQALDALRAAGIAAGLRHLASSGGVLGAVSPAYDLVRVGLAFYGLLPPGVAVPARLGPAAAALAPALSLRARAAAVTALPAGTRVGYAGTWRAERPSVVATVPLGYADGWARAYVPGSWAVARGRRAPLVGRVSSDAIALDVTDVPGFGAGDEVELLGPGPGSGVAGAPAMTVGDLAALRGSIAWEVLDALGPRLARVYTAGGVPVGVRLPDGRAAWSAPAAG